MGTESTLTLASEPKNIYEVPVELIVNEVWEVPTEMQIYDGCATI